MGVCVEGEVWLWCVLKVVLWVNCCVVISICSRSNWCVYSWVKFVLVRFYVCSGMEWGIDQLKRRVTVDVTKPKEQNLDGSNSRFTAIRSWKKKCPAQKTYHKSANFCGDRERSWPLEITPAARRKTWRSWWTAALINDWPLEQTSPQLDALADDETVRAGLLHLSGQTERGDLDSCRSLGAWTVTDFGLSDTI